jgi:hypothetical protein
MAWRHLALFAGGAVAAGLSAWAALTEPFTAGAEAVTALALVLVAAAAALRWRRAVAGPPLEPPSEPQGRWWPWIALATVVVAWELVSYFLGPRVDHPTVSSLYDSATRWRAVRGACFFAWLWLGAALVRT